MPNIQERPSLYEMAMTAGLLKLQNQLAQLDWSRPLTRAAIRQQWSAFPTYAFLRLPAAKSFCAPGAVVRHLLAVEQQGVDELPDEAVVLAEGGPPLWGADPLIAGSIQMSGSATDTTHQ
jgi:hypothetical protein